MNRDYDIAYGVLLMQPISRQRQLVEEEGRVHAVKRGRLGWLHFENLPFLAEVLRFSLRAAFLRSRGRRNAEAVMIEEVEINVASLPAEFDGTRILFLTDIHVDCLEGIEERILEAIGGLEYDLCILGGDYSFKMDRGYDTECAQKMEELARELVDRSSVYGVLGNHDRYQMAETLSAAGVRMLVNDSVAITKGDSRLHLVGIDDSHYFGANDLEAAQSLVRDGECRIVISHSPEPYRQIAEAGGNLQLSGHTHGGQVCLPGGIAIVTSTSVPYRIVKGLWSWDGMAGYTSRGIGASRVAVRFFCPPEVTVITLRNV